MKPSTANRQPIKMPLTLPAQPKPTRPTRREVIAGMVLHLAIGMAVGGWLMIAVWTIASWTSLNP